MMTYEARALYMVTGQSTGAYCELNGSFICMASPFRCGRQRREPLLAINVDTQRFVGAYRSHSTGHKMSGYSLSNKHGVHRLLIRSHTHHGPVQSEVSLLIQSVSSQRG